MNPMSEFPKQAGGYVLSAGKWWYAWRLNGKITRLTLEPFPDALKGWLPVRYWAEQIGGERAPHVMGKEPCPYCGALCWCDEVDVGVGVQQAGPYHCEECHASQIGPYDGKRELSDAEMSSGWYAPKSEPGSSANVIGGRIVTHKEARAVYRATYPLMTTERGRKMVREGGL